MEAILQSSDMSIGSDSNVHKVFLNLSKCNIWIFDSGIVKAHLHGNSLSR